MKGKTSVFGIFRSRANALQAVDQLKAAGFRNSDVAILLPSPEAHSTVSTENATKAPEGMATGAVAGAALGGVVGWLAGIGSLAIPGVGPFIASGPILGALAGLGVGGSVGGVSGALIGLGIPEYEATRYQSGISSGGVLLSVHVDDTEWADRARDILEQTGAEDISRKTEATAQVANY